MEAHPSRVQVIVFDIDGTLTDGKTWYAGDALGWLQRYSVRDGEAILRLTHRGIALVPLSRNRTLSARMRVESLGLATTWLGVGDKVASFEEILRHFGVAAQGFCFVGDGKEDAAILAKVGVGLAVADAHPAARAAAWRVLERAGGMHAMEEVELVLEALDFVPASTLKGETP